MPEKLDHQRFDKGRISHFHAYLTLLVGALVSILFYVTVHNEEQARFDAEFAGRAGNLAIAMQGGMENYFDSLNSVSDWFLAEVGNGVINGAKATRDQFGIIAKRLYKKYPGVTLMAMGPYVPFDQVSLFEESVRANLTPGFHLRGGDQDSRAPGSGVYPALFVEPSGENQELTGRDLASILKAGKSAGQGNIPGEWVIAPKSPDSGISTQIGGIVLVKSLLDANEPQTGGDAEPVAVFLAALDIEKLLGSLFSGIDFYGIRVLLFDMFNPELPSSRRFISGVENNTPFEKLAEGELDEIMSGIHVTRNITMANHPWSIILSPTPDYIGERLEYNAWMFMLGGVMITVLLAGYIDNVVQHTGEMERKVMERTMELTNANRELEKEITTRKTAEDDVRTKDNELAHAMRLAALGEMAAGVIHEVNQPMTAILTYVNNCIYSLKGDNANLEMVSENLEHVKSQVGRVHKITRYLQGFSRSDSQVFTKVNVNNIVQNVASFFVHQFRSKGIEFTMELDRALPDATGDLLRLEQVMMNIFLNAVHALEETGEKKICARTMAKSGSVIQIEISDNGHGMTEEELSNLFKPFFTTKSRDKGTGLGMSISRRIIEDHDGAIFAESEPGIGSTFIIELPTGEAQRGINAR